MLKKSRLKFIKKSKVGGGGMREGLLLNLDQSESATLRDIADVPFKLILNKLHISRVNKYI